MDKRIIIAGSALILILAVLSISVIRMDARQERNFESLLAEIRGNADQIQQMDRVFQKVGEDATEVREALLMEPVEYSVTPFISPEDQRGADRFQLFIKAFETFENYYSENERAASLEKMLTQSRYRLFTSERGLETELSGIDFSISGTVAGRELLLFSGSSTPQGITVRAAITDAVQKEISELDSLLQFIEKEYNAITEAGRQHRQFIAGFNAWIAKPNITRLLDDKKIVFETVEESIFSKELLLRTSDHREIGRVEYTDSNKISFLSYTYENFEEFMRSFPGIIDDIDTRSFGELKARKNIEAMKATINDAEFQSILSAYDMSIAESPREDSDFYYFDIEKNGKPYGAFGVLKKHGDLYILDTDDVPVTSLESLDVRRLLNEDPDHQDKAQESEAQSSAEKLDTVLLCGSHENNPDTMILLVSNTDTGKTNLFSLPRDLFYKGQKINNIYRHFGPEQFLKDISAITGLSVKKYINIDMYAFIDVINIIGGIDVTLNEPLVDPTYRVKEKGIWKTLHYPAGTHHLDGLGALRVARSRHTSSDFDRAERQQLIIASLVDKLGSIGNAATMYKLLNSAFRYVSTNLSPVEAVELAIGMKRSNISGKYVISTKNVLYHTTSAAGLWILLPKDDNWNNIAGFIKSKLY